MSLAFRPYRAADFIDCITLFDLNCPEFFAANERDHYVAFLESAPVGYEVCVDEGRVVGACSRISQTASSARLNWILLTRQVQGRGIGSMMIGRALERARRTNVSVIHIAASHRSAPFFARFGATVVARITDGWGFGMHRVDMELHV